MRIALPGAPDWILVNGGGYGFYRVRYETPLLERLTRQLDRLLPELAEKPEALHSAQAIIQSIEAAAAHYQL